MRDENFTISTTFPPISSQHRDRYVSPTVASLIHPSIPSTTAAQPRGSLTNSGIPYLYPSDPHKKKQSPPVGELTEPANQTDKNQLPTPSPIPMTSDRRNGADLVPFPLRLCCSPFPAPLSAGGGREGGHAPSVRIRHALPFLSLHSLSLELVGQSPSQNPITRCSTSSPSSIHDGIAQSLCVLHC